LIDEMKAVQFSNLILECATRTLRNQNGNKVVLRPLPYEVLLVLLQSEEPVTRDELFQRCWEGTVVTDQALTNVISSLRRNLLSLKAKCVEIKTISKVGYFIEVDGIEIERLPDVEAPEDVPRMFVDSELSALPPTHLDVPDSRTVNLAKLIPALLFTTLIITLLLISYFKPFSEKPAFIKKGRYEQFALGDTHYFFKDMTSGFVSSDEMQEQLSRTIPPTCGVDIYIRLFPSSYEPDKVALSVWLQQEGGKRNHNFRQFAVEKEQIATYISEALVNREVTCD
jgi:DNA-binding winged helix-turn-helix (wHTH) protein